MPYTLQLLRAGLGVPQSQVRIGSGREAWTLGAALAEGASVGVGHGRQPPLFSRSVLAAAAVAWLLWLLFLGWTWRGTVSCCGTQQVSCLSGSWQALDVGKLCCRRAAW